MTDQFTPALPRSILVPGFTVFLSNAAVMVVELVAGRVVSSYLGMSLYTWTAIIGVIMAGMTAGNFAGGWIADRFRPRRTLAAAFLLSAAAAVTLLQLNAMVGEWQALHGLPWPARIFFHVGIVFFMPGVLLGVINPVVAKMALDLGQATGLTIGRVFACGAAGSILGTFAAGYYLVLALGVREIVLAMAGVLGMLGLCYAASAINERRMVRVPAAGDRPTLRDVISGVGPAVTVFVSNASFMTLELAASRIVSRQFGSSLYTWTAVIGVVLAGVTLGNYSGGWIADRAASRKLLAYMFLGASVASVVSALGGAALGASWEFAYGLMVMPWPLQIATFMLLVFAIPCFFMGTISPIVIKLALREESGAGKLVGAIYAWGAAGAIVGTFATGYFLVDALGMVAVVLLVAVALALAAVAYAPAKLLPGALAIATGVLLVRSAAFPVTGRNVVYKEESNYSYIEILANPSLPNVRRMKLDKLVHSMVNTADPRQLGYPYEWVYEAVLDRHSTPGVPLRALVLGGGGFTFPHYLEVARPGSSIDVAEIDPAVTRAAHEAFGFPRETTVRVFNMDARNHVEDLLREIASGRAEPFDFVFGDSINDYSVPYHLTTREFARNVNALLKPGGVYMLNLIDVLDSGRFLAAAVGTCRSEFQHVAAFSTLGVADKRDTFVVISSDRPLELNGVVEQIKKNHDYAGRLLGHEELDALRAGTGNVVLTDNYAPVENLLAPVARTRNGSPADIRYQLARRYASKKWYAAATRQLRKALSQRADWDEAQTYLAWLCMEQGQMEEAEALLGRAAPDGGKRVDPLVALGKKRIEGGDAGEGLALISAALELDPTHLEARMQVAEFALRSGDVSQAVEHWIMAVADHPNEGAPLRRLGDHYAAQRQFDMAINYWKRAFALAPDDPVLIHNLLSALTVTGRADEAAATLAKADAAGVPVDSALRSQINQIPARE